jgi:hypothetical protein
MMSTALLLASPVKPVQSEAKGHSLQRSVRYSPLLKRRSVMKHFENRGSHFHIFIFPHFPIHQMSKVKKPSVGNNP